MCFVPFLKDVFDPFFFVENTINGNTYLDMLENWLMPELMNKEEQWFIFQQDGAPSHWYKDVWGYLNRHLPGRWSGRVMAKDNTLCTWPPHSMDLQCDFLCRVTSRTVFISLHLQRHLQNWEGVLWQPSRMSYKTCLRGVGVNGITDILHVELTLSATKVSTKLQTTLF